MNQPFNDQPIEILIKQYLIQEGTVLDLRLHWSGNPLADDEKPPPISPNDRPRAKVTNSICGAFHTLLLSLSFR